MPLCFYVRINPYFLKFFMNFLHDIRQGVFARTTERQNCFIMQKTKYQLTPVVHVLIFYSIMSLIALNTMNPFAITRVADRGFPASLNLSIALWLLVFLNAIVYPTMSLSKISWSSKLKKTVISKQRNDWVLLRRTKKNIFDIKNSLINIICFY